MDSFVTYFIGEAAQQIAQFQAGSIMVYTPTQFGDFQSLTSGMPGIRVLGSGILASTQGIGFLKDNPDSPFIKDARVRQAMSLTLDRENVMESFNDVDKYKSVGLTRDYRLANFVPPNLDQYWVDPRGKEMGDAAQYFQYDVAKAKQLLSAAGYGSGFDFVSHYSVNQANDLYQNAQPLLAQWWAAAGMRAKLTGEDYASVFNPHSWHGDGEGTANWTWQTFGDPGQQLDYLFGPTSTRNQMGVNDPKFNSMYDAQQAELDPAKRRSQLVSLYQYLGQEMRHIPWGYGTINTFSLHQAQIRNNWAYRTSDSPTGVVGTNSKHFWLAS
jgi:ABC-type transport system substrate-binding protein